MLAHPDPIIAQAQHQWQALLGFVTGPDAQRQTASAVERTLFRSLLALGATLFRLFLVSRAQTRPALA